VIDFGSVRLLGSLLACSVDQRVLHTRAATTKNSSGIA